MFNLLILSTSIEGDVEALYEQIKYIEQFGVHITLLVDADEIGLIREITDYTYDCAYIHIKKRFAEKEEGPSFDAAKILNHKNVPILGNSYITQLMVADKFLTSKKSGIGLPNILITRNMFTEGYIDWESIRKMNYPVIVKPNSLHASMGISKKSVAFTEENLKMVIHDIFNRFQNMEEILVERFMQNAKEYTVSALGNSDSLACSVARLDFHNPNEIHVNGETEKLLPLNERGFRFAVEDNSAIRSRLEFHAKTLFKHLNMKDIGRFDMVLDGTYYLLEANCCPIPGNSFSWEWQIKYGVEKKQIIALYLCANHFGNIASGKPSCLPKALIDAQPIEIISQINHPASVDTCPECSGPTDNCHRPHLFSMNDRVSSESEVHSFLKSLTVLLKPSFILETGTYKGSSTIAFSEGIRFNNYGHMVSIEVDTDLALKAKELFKEYSVDIINQDSLTYTPPCPIDLLFLDSKRILRKQEFHRFKPYLHEKSVIVWHDSSYREHSHAVFDAVNELYADGVIDRLLLPTPRGLTLSMLRSPNGI